MSRFGNSGHDDSLLSSMAARLRSVEEELANKNRIIEDKDKQLHHFRQNVGEDKSKDKLIVYLKGRVTKAFEQVQEMEEFLADYGMVWVGSSESPENTWEPLEEEEDEVEDAGGSIITQGTWNQGDSLGDINPDFNRIVHNVHELNILAGDGVGMVEKGADGITRVVQPDPIPLTLYCNGILMFAGPFRPLTDPLTRQFVQDLEDGYFPSELQARFPKGMPIKLKDLREKKYVDKRGSFPGKGTALSEGAKELAAIRGLLPGDGDSTQDVATDTNADPAPQSVERFLNKLPANVIRDGKIIDIRSSVNAMIGPSTTPVQVEVAKTSVVKQIQAGEGTSGPVATLRVKMDGGKKTVIVKLQYSNTIGDLRSFINEHHKKGLYEIRTTFPNKKYDRQSETLEDAGLVPSATLHIRDI